MSFAALISGPPFYQIDLQLHGITDGAATRYIIMHLASHVYNRIVQQIADVTHGVRIGIIYELVRECISFRSHLFDQNARLIYGRPGWFDVRTIGRSYHNGAGLCNGNLRPPWIINNERLITPARLSHFEPEYRSRLSCLSLFLLFLLHGSNKYAHLSAHI